MLLKEGFQSDHVHFRMIKSNVVITLVALIQIFVCCSEAAYQKKTATACYGNVNNYLHLDCHKDETIAVIRVVHGAKISQAACSSPASQDTYRKDCCQPEQTDCSIVTQDGAKVQCEGKVNCDAVATWSSTNKECDQDVYPPATNYMLMEYYCIGPGTETPTTIEKTLPFETNWSSPSTTLLLVPNRTETTPSTQSKPVSLVLDNDKPDENSNDELSDAMIGAIVGGSLGMCLTLVVFIFYWGRKRRLRIVGKTPQPTVWDYLLSQTFTVRGTRGYDHFSSVRSSASSDGEAGSPVVRKNLWLPNIVHSGDEPHDDSISNYDNDNYHRVEIHHDANPSPYAILSLDVNNGNRGNHDA